LKLILYEIIFIAMTNNVGAKEKLPPGTSDNSADPPKAKFKVNEKVLCYEPDNKKAQVLYDSKVS
jgi:hypothetical protein